MPSRSKTGVSRRQTLKLFSLASAPLTPTLALAASSPPRVELANGRGQDFDLGWRFFRGDGEDLAQKSFDDRNWRQVDLPHDWSIEDLYPAGPMANATIREVDTAPLWQDVKPEPLSIGPFEVGSEYRFASSRSAGLAKTGFTVGGVGWYRKRFRLPSMRNRHVELVFDGVYMNAEVFVNGQSAGFHPYGYAAFAVDLTPHLDPSGDNVVAVRVPNIGLNGRSYSGSGIYRHVRMNITAPRRFELWGVTVTTPAVSSASATVDVRARVVGPVAGAVVVTRIRDAAGQVVAQSRSPAGAETVAKLTVANPKLWSPETPALYVAECELMAGSQHLDTITTQFGVRSIEIDSRRGLRVNGKPYKLRGGCVHSDNGLLGAMAFDRAEERRVELLKARGFNAIRTAHNPPSTEFLDACDRLGMFVIDELFDVWRVPKSVDDYSVYFDGWWRKDLGSIIRRDRNHPSVVIWSLGNEVSEKLTDAGAEMTRVVAAELRRLDPTRPITWAVNGSNGPQVINSRGKPDEQVIQHLDIAGYNYKILTVPDEHEHFPDRVTVGTESYPKEVDATWRLVEKLPHLIGDFVWTAMDYIGESGIGRTGLAPLDPSPAGAPAGAPAQVYPWFNGFCGDIDLIGQQKPPSLLRDVVWGLSPLEMTVQRLLPEGRTERPSNYGWQDELRSWTWPDAAGKALNVQVYTRADRVVLELNGAKIGEKLLTEADKSVAHFSVPYTPGRLVATAYIGERQIGQRALETVEAPAALRLMPDRTRISASRNDLAFVTVEVVDGGGRLAPDAVSVVEVALSGPAELIAFGNANPRGVASFRQPVAKTWHGRALVIARPTGRPGELVVEARSAALRPAVARLTVA